MALSSLQRCAARTTAVMHAGSWRKLDEADVPTAAVQARAQAVLQPRWRSCMPATVFQAHWSRDSPGPGGCMRQISAARRGRQPRGSAADAPDLLRDSSAQAVSPRRGACAGVGHPACSRPYTCAFCSSVCRRDCLRTASKQAATRGTDPRRRSCCSEYLLRLEPAHAVFVDCEIKYDCLCKCDRIFVFFWQICGLGILAASSASPRQVCQATKSNNKAQ